LEFLLIEDGARDTPPKPGNAITGSAARSRSAGMVMVSFVRLMSSFRALQYNV